MRIFHIFIVLLVYFSVYNPITAQQKKSKPIQEWSVGGYIAPVLLFDSDLNTWHEKPFIYSTSIGGRVNFKFNNVFGALAGIDFNYATKGDYYNTRPRTPNDPIPANQYSMTIWYMTHQDTGMYHIRHSELNCTPYLGLQLYLWDKKPFSVHINVMYVLEFAIFYKQQSITIANNEKKYGTVWGGLNYWGRPRLGIGLSYKINKQYRLFAESYFSMYTTNEKPKIHAYPVNLGFNMGISCILSSKK